MKCSVSRTSRSEETKEESEKEEIMTRIIIKISVRDPCDFNRTHGGKVECEDMAGKKSVKKIFNRKETRKHVKPMQSSLGFARCRGLLTR
jgi:hypothetical protein